MNWPEAPTVHRGAWPASSLDGGAWQQRTIQGRLPDGVTAPTPDAPQPFLQCGYCGSIRPEDFVRILAGTCTVEVADLKYDWPHKIYVWEIPNPHPEVQRVMSRGPGPHDIKWGADRVLWAKFYTEHLLDEGYDEKAIEALKSVLRERARLDFIVDAGALKWRAI
jgi:hypothetical protein